MPAPGDAECRRRRADVATELRALVDELRAVTRFTDARRAFLTAYAYGGLNAYYAVPSACDSAAAAVAHTPHPSTATTSVEHAFTHTAGSGSTTKRPRAPHQKDDAGVPPHILARHLRDRRARALRAEAERAEHERMTPMPAIVLEPLAL